LKTISWEDASEDEFRNLSPELKGQMTLSYDKTLVQLGIPSPLPLISSNKLFYVDK